MTDLSRNAGRGASIQVQQQQQQPFASSLLQIMAQANQPPLPNPLPSQADVVADLISSIQRQRSNQQLSIISSQQSALNQNSHLPNNANASGILQSFVGSNQQLLPSPHSTPSQQTVPNHANHRSNVDAINHLQTFQQWSHQNPTLNILNTAPSLSIMAGSQAPSNAIHALVNLCGMILPQRTLPNTSISAPMSQLLLLMHRVVEEELQRRFQAHAMHEAIIGTIGQIVGGNNLIDESERQRGLEAALGQTIGGTREAKSPKVPLSNPTGMTVRVPRNPAAHSQHAGPPPSPGGNMGASIAAILQAAETGQLV